MIVFFLKSAPVTSLEEDALDWSLRHQCHRQELIGEELTTSSLSCT